MKTEEAAQWLEQYVDNDCYTTNFQEVCKMAISALRAQQEVAKNDPLTLDELREMDHDSPPIWDSCLNEWCAVRQRSGSKRVFYINGGWRPLEAGRFYRHKPKEE